MNELFDRLDAIARVPILLVASDYDGTIAPIVSDPSKAFPERESCVAVRELAALPQTHVAIISGRAIRDLALLAGLPEDVHLVGSHGSEFDADFAQTIDEQSKSLRGRVLDELFEIASSNNGFHLEEKPASVAFHYRNAPEHEAASAVAQILDGPAQLEGVFTKQGKKVIELAVVATNKGTALERIRQRVGASAVVFIGDDETDEDAFAVLKGPDLGIKVGEGESGAHFRIADTREVAAVLARLCEQRSKWLAGSAAVPIQEHAMLSDQRTLALVTPEARVTWFCVPRVDSPAIFAELLGGPAAGHFSIRPADSEHPPAQKYVGDSLNLETSWDSMKVTDFLDCSGGKPSQRAGRTELIRILEGRGEAVIEFAPRLDFGRGITRLASRNGGLVVEDSLDPIILYAPGVSWELVREGQHDLARATVDLDRGPVILELRCGTGSLRDRQSSAQRRRELTEQYWNSWADQLVLPSVAPELVKRSAVTLRALMYGPTGALSAAGTTSLPEHLGGVRNWDYRYCWLRDGAMSMSSLLKLGAIQEGMRFLDWVLGVLDQSPSPQSLQPLYTVTGGQLAPEAEIGELAGYCGSRPVRVGNAAARQVQLDVFGSVTDLIHQLLEHDAPLSGEHWRLVEAMVEAIQSRWKEPDHGIWEIRKPRRHHVHSKLMCWLTVDRAIKIASGFFDRTRPEWITLRDEIGAEINDRAFNRPLEAFTAAYGEPDLDAATLLIGLTGLLKADDPRFKSTVRAIEKELLDGPVVYRYRADDGLPGQEGGFPLCSAWMVQAYIALGEFEKAKDLFGQICDLAGRTGLISEQYDPQIRRALGNHPQAYSHLAVIDCACALDSIR